MRCRREAEKCELSKQTGGTPFKIPPKKPKPMNDNANSELKDIQDSEVRVVALLPRPDKGNPFWGAIRHGIEVAAATEGMAEIEFKDFDMEDESEFAKKTSEVIEEKPDGVIVAPVFQNKSQEFCIDMDLQGVPYIFVNTSVNGTNEIGYVGEDSYHSGRIAANIMDVAVGQERDILMVNIGNTQHLYARSKGFLSYFAFGKRNEGLRLALNLPNADETVVTKELNQVLKKANIGGIWVSNSKSYVIADYLKSRGERDIVVVGYDLHERNLSMMQDGQIGFLLDQRPQEQGVKALRSMVRYIKTKEKPKRNDYSKIRIVNAEVLAYND